MFTPTRVTLVAVPTLLFAIACLFVFELPAVMSRSLFFAVFSFTVLLRTGAQSILGSLRWLAANRLIALFVLFFTAVVAAMSLGFGQSAAATVLDAVFAFYFFWAFSASALGRRPRLP